MSTGFKMDRTELHMPLLAPNEARALEFAAFARSVQRAAREQAHRIVKIELRRFDRRQA
jgi:hypothetical protein